MKDMTFDEWLDAAIDHDMVGNAITRRRQIELGPMPSVAFGWAMIAFRAGQKSMEPKMDALLNHCQEGECHVCSEIICQHDCGMHFHHDGCPACAELGVGS